MKRPYQIFLSVCAGVVLAALIAYMQTLPQSAPQDSGIAGTPIGGTFDGLVDQNGDVVTPQTFAGKHQLVFFGFTHCPAICPLTLQKITTALTDLSPAERAKLAVIFVSVDPQRDTPQALRDYLSLFKADITGLTGSDEAVKRTLSEWKVYAAKVQTPDMVDYTVDHSAFIYFRDPDGRLIDLFEQNDPKQVLFEGLKAALKG